MESRVLAILLSSFLVVAFIAEKAAGYIAPQCPPFCTMYCIAAIARIALTFFRTEEVSQKI